VRTFRSAVTVQWSQFNRRGHRQRRPEDAFFHATFARRGTRAFVRTRHVDADEETR
jgi:hypothetical protein